MTAEQLLLDETHAWLGRARRDLHSAALLIAGGAYDDALFHCQQAAEKAFKAFLAFHQRPFRKTHELGELIPECEAIDPTLRPALTEAKELTKYAWVFRYPGAPYEPDAAEAAGAFATAEAVVREMEERLPPRPTAP
jgi:HEPN domain-containing protein